MKTILFTLLTIGLLGCSSGNEDIGMDKLTEMLNHYQEGLKPGALLTSINQFDANAKIYKGDVNRYESVFKTEEAEGYLFYENIFSEDPIIEDLFLKVSYLEKANANKKQEANRDNKPYIDYITKTLDMSYRMGDAAEGNEDRYYWDKDGFVFWFRPEWNGFAFHIALPE